MRSTEPDASGPPSVALPEAVALSGSATGAGERPGGIALWRRLLAEFVGTAFLLVAVVGSGIMAVNLSPGDVGLQLMENVFAIVMALAALILIFGPVSGAHFNPVVSAADWYLGRRLRTGLTAAELGYYTIAQTLGGVAGTIIANVMFALPAIELSEHRRIGAELWLGEVVATSGLILLVFALARSGRAAVAPAAVACYIGAAAWFTSSASFVNPAVTVARAFTDTFTGISPGSVPGFAAAQLLGMIAGIGLLQLLYPGVGQAAGKVVVPSENIDSDS